MFHIRMLYFVLIVLLMGTNSIAVAGESKPLQPSAEDRCPVCGMFVAKYPDFLAEIVFSDGSHAYFDGTKDMFKYYLHLSKYNPSKKRSDVKAIFVNDYYKLEPIDGFKAVYITGSDIFGPMGHELIPFSTEAEAEEFMRDHSGKAMLRFENITLDVVKSLD